MVFSTVKRVDKAHDDGIWCVDWHQDRIATGSLGPFVKTWHAGTLEIEHNVTPLEHQLAITSVSLSAAGSTLVTSSLDSMIQVWDLRDGKTENRCSIQTPPAESWGAKLSPDGTRVAVTGQGGCFSVYNVADSTKDTRTKQLELQTGAKFGYSLAWSADGARAACGAMDGVVALFDIVNARRLHALVGVHLMPVRSVSFSPDGARLLAASDDALVSMCDVETGKTISTFAGHSSWVLSVAHNPAAGSKLFATGSSDKTVRLWDVNVKSPVHVFNEHKDQVWNVAFNDDGTSLVSVSDDGTLVIYSTVAQ